MLEHVLQARAIRRLKRIIRIEVMTACYLSVYRSRNLILAQYNSPERDCTVSEADFNEIFLPFSGETLPTTITIIVVYIIYFARQHARLYRRRQTNCLNRTCHSDDTRDPVVRSTHGLTGAGVAADV